MKAIGKNVPFVLTHWIIKQVNESDTGSAILPGLTADELNDIFCLSRA